MLAQLGKIWRLEFLKVVLSQIIPTWFLDPDIIGEAGIE
jgi:hypothetical protein